MKRYAIVGFGCAGMHAAAAIRKQDPVGEIVVFSDTNEPPFNPMLNTYYASERLNEQGVFPFGDLSAIRDRLSLIIRTETPVHYINVTEKTVELEDGSRQAFDAILVATGASVLVPSPLLHGGGRFFVMRTLEDAKSLRGYLEQHTVKKAVVVGGSMVGIKVAELLYRRGIETTIVDGAEYLFPMAAYRGFAETIQDRLCSLGIQFVFGAQVMDILPEGILLADGSLLEAEVVCLCIGTRTNLQMVPNTRTVEGQGLEINRGIVVDQQMRTNVSGIYAAGDCSEGINLQTKKTAIIGLWANAGAQGDCAGSNMAGKSCCYYGNILHNITHFFDMDFIGLGDPSLPGEHHSFPCKNYEVEIVLDENQLNSINILGNYRISGILKNHLTKRLLGENAGLTRMQKGVLKSEGLPDEFINMVGGVIK